MVIECRVCKDRGQIIEVFYKAIPQIDGSVFQKAHNQKGGLKHEHVPRKVKEVLVR